MSTGHGRGTKLTMLMLVGALVAVVWVSAAIAVSVSGSTEAISGDHGGDIGRVPTTEGISGFESQIAVATADEAEGIPSGSETSSALRSGAGRRMLSVNAEGGAVEVANYDVDADVGPATAVVKEFDVAVTGGTLHLAFTASANRSTISGIEVVSS